MTKSNAAFGKRAQDVYEAAREKLQALCEGRERFRMRVPAQPDDPDLVIAAALTALPEALKRLAKAEAALSPVCAELKATCAERDHLRAEVKAWEATGKNLGFVKGARRK